LKNKHNFQVGKLYRVYTDHFENINYWAGWLDKEEIKYVACHLFYGDIVVFLEGYDKGPHLKLLTEDGITAWFYHNPNYYTLEEVKNK
jgi:hypothetical protein